MNTKSVRKSFVFSTDALLGAAHRLLEALQDASIAPAVTAHLSATFVADFEAQIALVAQSGTDQSSALGTAHTLTRSQAAAELALRQASVAARASAVLAFPGQDLLLRSEFQVGVQEPTGVNSVLGRARKLLAACQKYSDVLALHGWTAVSMTALTAAVDGLATTARSQDAAFDVKEGSTADRNAAANALYRQCRTVLNAARFAYPASQATHDPSVVLARARFLIGELPPRPRAVASPTAVPAAPAALPAAPAAVPAAA